MEIKDINFDILESVRKKCITFAKDGSAVVKPYKTLYNVEQITHNVEHHNLYFEIVKGKKFWEQDRYFLWDDLGKICVKVDFIREYWTLENFIEALHEYKYFGADGFFKRLKALEENGYHINKEEIEICTILGEIELAKHYAEYREERLRIREEKRQEEIAERKAKEREEKEKHNAEVRRTVAGAENTIRTQGTLHNEEFEGKTIVLYLLKKYGINVPIKTQGWVNNALAKVWFQDGEITYSYYTSSKDSTVFWKYLKELEKKILQSA